MRLFNREKEEADVAEALKVPLAQPATQENAKWYVLIDNDGNNHAIGPFPRRDLADAWKQGALFIENDAFRVLCIVKDFEAEDIDQLEPGTRP